MTIKEHFATLGEINAIIDGDNVYTYHDLIARVEYHTKALEKVKSGERVVMVADYSFEAISFFIALHLHHAIIIPLTPSPQGEIDEKINVSGANWIATFSGGSVSLEGVENPSPLHPMLVSLVEKQRSALVLFSSGSTGKPKAMVHDLDTLISHFEGKKGKKLTLLLFLMFDHIGGINTLLNILFMGSTMVIPSNRSPHHICELIAKHRIIVLPSSPTFLNLILMSQAHTLYDLASLRMITYGTEAMPSSLLLRLKEAFPKVKFLQTFGTSETGIATTSSKSSDSTFMRIDDPTLAYKIVDGVLWLKSETQILGYLNASMESFHEGWFNTGDLVETTDDGYLKIIGRAKEVINVGGQKVLPVEVESILLLMDEVEDCMVRGEANAITGQTVIADIVLDKNTDPKEIKKRVRLFCKERLEGYKIPTKVNVVEHTNFSERFKKMRVKQ